VSVVSPGVIGTDIAANSGVTLAGDASTETATYKTTSPVQAGKVIVEAIEKARFRATIGSDAAAMDRLARLNPRFATTLIAKQMGELIEA